MKAKLKKRIRKKSSHIRALLFLLVFSTSGYAAMGVTLVSDTIIIGGKKLIVEREVVYDTLSEAGDRLEPEKPRRKRLKRGDARIGFRASGYLPVDQITSDIPGAYSSVGAFVGSDSRVGSGVSFELYAERKLGMRGWFVTTGVGIDYLNGKNLTFDSEAIDDSLFTFASFENDQLDQILLFRFDIGSETDTLGMPLFDDPYRSSWLRIPIGVGYERELSRQSILRFCAGIDIRINLSGEQPDFIFLPDLGNEVVIQTAEEIGFRAMALTPWVSGGVRWQMDRRWCLTTELRGSLPFRPLSTDSPVEVRSVLLSGQVGVCYQLGR